MGSPPERRTPVKVRKRCNGGLPERRTPVKVGKRCNGEPAGAPNPCQSRKTLQWGARRSAEPPPNRKTLQWGARWSAEPLSKSENAAMVSPPERRTPAKVGKRCNGARRSAEPPPKSENAAMGSPPERRTPVKVRKRCNGEPAGAPNPCQSQKTLQWGARRSAGREVNDGLAKRISFFRQQAFRKGYEMKSSAARRAARRFFKVRPSSRSFFQSYHNPTPKT